MRRFNLAPVLRIGAVVKYSDEGLRPYRDSWLDTPASRPGWREAARRKYRQTAEARGVIFGRLASGWAVVWVPRPAGNVRPSVSFTSAYLLEVAR